MRCEFIRSESKHYPVSVLCEVMKVSRSSYYAWKQRPAALITAETLHLYRRMKALFKQSRSSLGSREMRKRLCKEGIIIGRYRVRKLMKKMNLVVTQRIAYKVTTTQNAKESKSADWVQRDFNPQKANEIWAGDITYIKTGEGWAYLAIVMDLFSRRIIGWHIDKRMNTDLISKALIKAYNARQPDCGVIFHSDHGSQYTSKQYRALLMSYGMTSSMGKTGVCWE